MADSIQKPQVLARPFCSNGDKNTIPDAATGTNLASLQEGFPEITGKPLKNGGIPPERRDFNGLLNMDSQFYFAFQNGWRPTFDAEVSTAIGGYAQGAVLWYDAGNCFVKSLKNNNTDNFVSDPTKIDGVSWLQLTAGEFQMPLFAPAWFDYQPNMMSWLRADTFSWQDGSVYSTAYNHLVDDIDGITASTETIEGTTITYYQATDGHKIVLADQENNVSTIYASTGVAWYYILDTDNTRFKLPRINPNVKEIDITTQFPVIGNGKTVGWTNGTEDFSFGATPDQQNLSVFNKSAFNINVGDSITYVTTYNPTAGKAIGLTTDETKSGIIADVSNKSTIYAGNKYLYFYVGQFSQSAIEQTAGLNTELFNGKVDLDGHNATFAHIVETYHNGTNWYRVWSDGWCEQGGIYGSWTGNITATINFLKEFTNTNYSVQVMQKGGINSDSFNGFGIVNMTTASMGVWLYTGVRDGFFWEAKGYIS